MIDYQRAGLPRHGQNNLIRKFDATASFKIGSGNEFPDFIVKLLL